MASIEGESEGYNRSMRHSDTSHMVDKAQRGDHNRPLDHGSLGRVSTNNELIVTKKS